MAPRPRVFVDIQSPAVTGRLIIELFNDKAPKTCENFRSLCTGEKGTDLTYKDSVFHRVVADPAYLVQGGDITAGDGTGGKSIYGEPFADENLNWRSIDEPGLLCMANKGPDTNTSQFIITLAACTDLDEKCCCFGRVIPESLPLLDSFANVEIDLDNDDDRPVAGQEPRIVQCGELIFKKKKKPQTEERQETSRKRSVSPDRRRDRSLSRSRSRSPVVSRSRRRSSSSVESVDRKKRSEDDQDPERPEKKDPLEPVRNPLSRTYDRRRHSREPEDRDRDRDRDRRDRDSRRRHEGGHEDRYRERRPHDRRRVDYHDRDYDRDSYRGSDSRERFSNGGGGEDESKSGAPPIKYKGRGKMTYRERF
ncbi:cyclophilin-like domain-containing protein [Myxozyma melibiosi]|uniref:peptidylprolyl isomerase n=1 Tax=Myxozyma melibiosi TaxID=54550 RepID=A0ABR1F0I9_9ASCO